MDFPFYETTTIGDLRKIVADHRIFSNSQPGEMTDDGALIRTVFEDLDIEVYPAGYKIEYMFKLSHKAGLFICGFMDPSWTFEQLRNDLLGKIDVNLRGLPIELLIRKTDPNQRITNSWREAEEAFRFHRKVPHWDRNTLAPQFDRRPGDGAFPRDL